MRPLHEKAREHAGAGGDQIAVELGFEPLDLVTTLPLMSVEFHSSGPVSVVDATYLRIGFKRSAQRPSPAMEGQTAANPS